MYAHDSLCSYFIMLQFTVLTSELNRFSLVLYDFYHAMLCRARIAITCRLSVCPSQHTWIVIICWNTWTII